MLKKLKYKFENPEILKAALTHRSTVSSRLDEGPDEIDNQRLEFLGDAVLDLIISDFLYRLEPHLSEGEMSRVRAAFVCETRLAEVARRLNLGEALALGPGEAHGGGRDKPKVLADAMEALLGAIYLDGGLAAAMEEARRLWKPYLQNPEKWEDILTDFKTRLQEETQGRGLGTPHYELLETNGPPHARLFTMAIRLGEKEVARAEAGSKKEAEQRAAREAMRILKT